MNYSKKLLPINEFCEDSNGNNVNSRIILQDFKNANNLIQYLNDSREIKFLKKGKYHIKLKLLLNNTNESDRIGIKLGTEIIKRYNIPIKQNIEISKIFTITINNTNKTLSIINISDDKLILKSKKGGYIMDNSLLAIDLIEEPISLTTSAPNNKTVTIILNSNFKETDDINLYTTDNMQPINNFKVVEDSIDPAPNKKVIVISTRFESNKSYTVKLTRNSQTAEAQFTVPKSQIPPINAQVDVFGDRILNLKFDVPINHLDAKYTVHNFLNNFYILYYNNDSTGSLTQDGNIITPDWFGMLPIGDETSTENLVVTPRESSDLRSLEIQFNKRAIPTGSHKFIINFSKAQLNNPSFALRDFSDDVNLVPIMEKGITIVKDSEAAKPISLSVIDRTSLIVNFDKPVLLLQSEFNSISVPEVPITILNVTRVGNNFKTLKYELSNNTPLPIKNIDVTVGKITDANGYKTLETTFTNIPVIAIKPKILDVKQYENHQSKIIVKFSKSMKTTGDGSVTNHLNYTISKLDGTFIHPQSATNYDDTEYTVILTMNEDLEAGDHTLSAQNIEDYFGLAMDPQDITFPVIDVSEPLIENITYHNQAIVIKFNERMQTSGEHSITEISNYRLEDSSSHEMKQLASGTSFFTMKNNKWIRITTVQNTNISTGLKINVGYKALKYIKYVTNSSENILDICADRTIGSEIEAIDISSTTSSRDLSIIAHDKLQYKYPGNNEFYSVNKNDFTIKLNGEEKTPNIVNMIDDKTLEFIFAPNTFDAGSTNITFQTNPEIISTTDIFGYKIVPDSTYQGQISNKIAVKISGISLVDTNKIRMVFNKDISIFGVTDFGCKETSSSSTTNIAITGSSMYKSNAKIWDLSLASNVGLTNELSIYQAVSDDLIQTTDSTSNKLAPFTPILVNRFFSNSIEWKHPSSSTTLANNKLIIHFTTPINPATFIQDTNFDSSNPGDAWDGNILNIPITKVLLTHSNPSFNNNDTMKLENNTSFGTIDFGSNTILTGNTSNSAEASLTLSEDKKTVTLEFKSDTTTINLSNSDTLTYYPSNDVMNSTNSIYLNSGFKPMVNPSDE